MSFKVVSTEHKGQAQQWISLESMDGTELWAPITGILALLTALVLQQKALLVFFAWLIVLAGYRAVLKQRLGGYTGDTLGAAVEIQKAVLLTALAL